MAAVQKMNNMKKRVPFKLKSGNKPSIAKIAGVEKETPKRRNIFKDINTKLQNLGKKVEEFKAKRKSKSNVNIKQDIQDKVARTRRGESKFQETARMKREFNKSKRRNAEKIASAKKDAENRAAEKITSAKTKKKDTAKKVVVDKATDKKATKTTVKKTGATSYAEYAKKGGDVKAAKDYNMKTYGTLSPTAKAKKLGISKSELAKRYKASNKTKKAKSTYDPKKDPILRNIKKRKEEKKQRKSDDPLGIKKNLASPKSTAKGKKRVGDSKSPKDLKKVFKKSYEDFKKYPYL